MEEFDFIPQFPIDVYIDWAKEQDANFLDINSKMWSKLNHNVLLYAYNKKKELVDDIEDFETFCKMSYIVQAYHKVWEKMVSDEIEEIIREISV